MKKNINFNLNIKKRKKRKLVSLIATGFLLLEGLFVVSPVLADRREEELSYSELLEKIDQGQVSKVELDPATETAKVFFKGQDEKEFEKLKVFKENSELISRIRNNNVEFSVESSAEAAAKARLLVQIMFVFLIIFLLVVLIKKSVNSATGAMSFGKSKAKFQIEAKTETQFSDVAGIEEAKEELQEVVTFLKTPEKFTAIGARIPRGVLLIGPPGTGKTLLAKAIAGEAGVPFLSISGSEFVEMFVGVGASRVRDLFRKAKESAPCIVFIDEIDAVGRQRGGGYGGGNDEREQTLNQLLTEMDGFEGNNGVIVIAATNRPDVLDPALLRPGRFDRQITVDYPDLEGRLGILEVHAANKKIDPEVSLRVIAQRTVGFSGADLANLLNEAAILTARYRKEAMTMAEVNEAIDKVIAGLERRALVDGKNKKIIAYHEIGHAIICHFLPENDPVEKVTIIPRGQSLGSTWYLPDEEQGLLSRSKLLAGVSRTLGGRAAEEVVFGVDEITNGATDDIDKVSSRVRQMVKEWGMSGLGHFNIEDDEYSEDLAAKIDLEVHKIVFSCYEKAKQIIRDNRALVEHLAEVVLYEETIEGDRFREIVANFNKTQPVLAKT